MSTIIIPGETDLMLRSSTEQNDHSGTCVQQFGCAKKSKRRRKKKKNGKEEVKLSVCRRHNLIYKNPSKINKYCWG